MPERPIRALIFDVDGTLAETEETHRQAFSTAFSEAGLPYSWDRSLYGELLAVTGGKRRILEFFRRIGRPLDAEAEALATELHRAKNRFYAETLAAGGLALRPGVADLVARARAAGLAVAVATTTGRANLEALLAAVGAALPKGFDVTITGDDVARLKPDPEVYRLCLERLGLPPEQCLAFEDSENGVRAAVAAGIATIATPGLYTSRHDFRLARRVLADLSGFDWQAP